MMVLGSILLAVSLQMAWAGLWSFFPIVAATAGIMLGLGHRTYLKESDDRTEEETGVSPGSAEAVFPPD